MLKLPKSCAQVCAVDGYKRKRRLEWDYPRESQELKGERREEWGLGRKDKEKAEKKRERQSLGIRSRYCSRKEEENLRQRQLSWGWDNKLQTALTSLHKEVILILAPE